MSNSLVLTLESLDFPPRGEKSQRIWSKAISFSLFRSALLRLRVRLRSTANRTPHAMWSTHVSMMPKGAGRSCCHQEQDQTGLRAHTLGLRRRTLVNYQLRSSACSSRWTASTTTFPVMIRLISLFPGTALRGKLDFVLCSSGNHAALHVRAAGLKAEGRRGGRFQTARRRAGPEIPAILSCRLCYIDCRCSRRRFPYQISSIASAASMP